jgi:predicted dehydrogenase
MNLQKTRWALIGCGEHGIRSHAVPGEKIEGLELVAVCDPNLSARTLVEKTVGRSLRHLTEKDVYTRHDIDAVVIGSPDRFHLASLEKAVAAGMHVLCEKPLATEVGDLERLTAILNMAREKGLVVTSCHPRRFDPPYIFMRKKLEQFVERFGSIESLQLDFSYHAPSKEGLHKGLLIDHINHELDTANFLLGYSPTWMMRIKDSQTQYQAVGARKDGITLFFEGTRKLNTQTYPEFVRVRFERGYVELDCKRGQTTTCKHEEVGNPKNYQEVDRVPKTNYKLRFLNVMRNFADSIHGVTENYLTHQDLLDNSAVGVHLTESRHWDPEGLLS